MLGKEVFHSESFDSLQSYVVLRIFFLDTGLLRILLPKDYILTTPW